MKKVICVYCLDNYNGNNYELHECLIGVFESVDKAQEHFKGRNDLFYYEWEMNTGDNNYISNKLK